MSTPFELVHAMRGLKYLVEITLILSLVQKLCNRTQQCIILQMNGNRNFKGFQNILHLAMNIPKVEKKPLVALPFSMA